MGEYVGAYRPPGKSLVLFAPAGTIRSLESELFSIAILFCNQHPNRTQSRKTETRRNAEQDKTGNKMFANCERECPASKSYAQTYHALRTRILFF